jgi:hypothetical protein
MARMRQNLAAHRSPQAQNAGDITVEVPDDLTPLKRAAVAEDWGDEDVVLRRYLAVHVPLAIEQGRFALIGSQLVMRAGQLETAAGTAVYLRLARAEGQRWVLPWAGARPNDIPPLDPPDLGCWAELDHRREVVVAMDRFPGPILASLPLVAQNFAIAGTLRGYFAPVHLTCHPRGTRARPLWFLVSHDLFEDQERRILLDWLQDEFALLVADDEGMVGARSPRPDQVLVALHALDQVTETWRRSPWPAR